MFIGDVFIIFVSQTGYADLASARQTFERDRRFFDAPRSSALYLVLCEVVEGYAPLLDALEDYADVLEERIFGTGPVPAQDVYRLTRELIELDRAVSPLGGLIPALGATFDHNKSPEPLRLRVREMRDHVHSSIDRAERLRNLAREIFTVNATLIAEQQNEQMKKISAWAGIFFFPTLIAGVYGMNFTRMPELHWMLGYPFALGLMFSGSLVLYLGFRQVRWL